MENILQSKIGFALDLLSQANNAMIEAIHVAVKLSEEKAISYTEQDGIAVEKRTIKYNEDGDLCMFDDCDNELLQIDDLTADDLYDICLSLSE